MKVLVGCREENKSARQHIFENATYKCEEPISLTVSVWSRSRVCESFSSFSQQWVVIPFTANCQKYAVDPLHVAESAIFSARTFKGDGVIETV